LSTASEQQLSGSTVVADVEFLKTID